MAAALQNRIRTLREGQGTSQQAFARAAGISRQSLSAIEAGRSEPSAAVALRIANALACRFDDVFFADAGTFIEAEIEPAAQGRGFASDQRVVLSNLNGRWVGHELGRQGAHGSRYAADGLVAREPGRAGAATRVETLRPPTELRDTVVLLGCAPALATLADRVNQGSRDARVVWLERSSGEALSALDRGRAHVAGVHFVDTQTGEHNLPDVRRGLKKRRASLFALARWEAGLVVAAGNPLGIRGIADLARPRLRVVTREPGAAARRLFEDKLKQARLPAKRILDHARVAYGQFDVAQAVSLGAADVGVAMQHAAIVYGLGFIPIAEEHFDLVFSTESLSDSRIARVLDVLASAAFRRDLESLGGYDAATCGTRIAEIGAT